MKKIFKLFLLVIPVAIWSCTEQLELTDPTQISEEDALADGGIEGVAITMYNSLQGTGYYGARMMVVGDVFADNITATFASNRYATEYDVTPTSGMDIWFAGYETIQAANTLLFYVDDSDVSESRKDFLRGEGHFIRALAYHDLIKSYAYEPGLIQDGFNQGVIIRTEPVRGASEADFRARSTVSEVYDLILSDLNAAIGLLDNSGENFRASQAAAYALRARVNAHLENWQGVVDDATAALNSGVGSLVPADEYLDAWRGANHPEAIFELVYDPVLENVGANNSLASVTTELFWGDLAMTEDLQSLFAADDVRRQLWFEATISTGTYMFQSKWTGSTGSTSFDSLGAPIFGTNSTFSDNIPILRYSEMLLLRAEAYAELGQDGSAQDDLNALRVERGLAPLSTTGSALMEDILEERRRELMFEGQRWFTLKRKGITIPKPDGNANPIDPDDFKILSPIPQGEVFLNELLIQNPGY